MSQLRRLLSSGSMPGGLLFIGPESTGKLLTAQAVAMSANCQREADKPQEGCGVCSSCSRIRSGNHPDVFLIKPDGNFIKIGQIRELIDKISTRPKEAFVRFVVIDGAHTMNLEASNALLKSLEEPPRNTVFILISTSLMSVLPTIRSRCIQIGFSPLGADIIGKILTSVLGYPSKDSESAAMMSGGGVRMSVEAIEKGWLDKRRWLYSELATIRSRTIPAVLALAEDLSHKGEEIKSYLEIVKTFFRDLVVLKYRKDSFCGSELEVLLSSAMPQYQENEIVALLGKVHEAQRSLELNAVSRLVLEMLFLKIAGFHK